VINTDKNINIIVLITIPQEYLKETDNKIVKRLQILIKNVLEILNKLIFYEKIYSNGNSAIIIALAKYKKQLDERQRYYQQMLPQALLDRWFITQS
jgi:hypothetical protein